MTRPNDLASLVETLTAASLSSAGISGVAGSPANLGRSSGSQEAIPSGLDQLLTQLNQIVTQANATPITRRPVTQPAAASGEAGNLGLDILKGVASTFTGGLFPLASGLIKLFSGGSETTADPLTKFALPAAIQAEAGLSSSGALTLVDRNVNGDVRGVGQPGATQITVQVNALDSQSFMDRSGDIAQAVRSAMLNSSALNEVIQDL